VVPRGLAAIIVQEGLVAKQWLAAHTTGYDAIEPVLRRIDVARYAATCGVTRTCCAARRGASRARRACRMMEDLGVQMNVHSTLNSYLQRLVWLLTGHYGAEGTNNAFVPFLSLAKLSKARARRNPCSP